MSYQVLARKWRPQNFKQMVGQEHVLKALIHALESQRLHHAYLFTGTRGVGKTTIGRILAKCLSCQTGITAEPCGTCSACVGITEGRYVDLIEIDAASRTKVEDMRELLDNVQYAPSEGRFKIYLIDEVHMLSQSSFNALLKTLEEPPEHVKFLFATTDPQKLPVTILSRCLQFNLKNMSPERIVQHLTHVLSEESVGFEEAALWALARAADGSMRDALSLTDQAIAYGNHQLSDEGVTAMLGTVDQKRIYRILDALLVSDAAKVMQEVNELAEFSPDYAAVLASLLSILHRVAIEQAVPGATDNAMGDQQLIQSYAQRLSAEDVQLYYQIALVSRKDLSISPDPRAGLEMALLRMLAFQLERPDFAPQESLPQSAVQVASGTESEGLESSGSSSGSVESERVESTDVESTDVESTVVDRADVESSSAAMAEQPAAEAPVIATESASGGPVGSDLPPVDAYQDEMAQAQDEQGSYMELPQAHPVQGDEFKKKTEFTLGHESVQGTDVSESATDVPLTQHSSAPNVGENPSAPVPPSVDSAESSPHNDDLRSDQLSEQIADQTAEHAAATEGELEWPQLATQLGLTGMTLNFLLNMYAKFEESSVRLYVETGHYRLFTRNHESRIVEAMRARFGSDFGIEFTEGLQAGQETPMMWRERRAAERLAEAKVAVKADPNVIQLLEAFDAILLEDSVEALGELS